MTASTKPPSQPLSQAASDKSIRRIKQLLEEGMSQSEICEVLNSEGYTTIRLQAWNSNNLRQVIYKIRNSLSSWYGLSAKRAQLMLPAVGAAQ